MLKLRQVSFLDHPELIGSAHMGIKRSPESIAEELNLVTERSFDDLGVFEFLALQIEEGVIAFRRYTAKPDQYSYVSVDGIAQSEISNILQSVLPGEELEIIEMEGAW